MYCNNQVLNSIALNPTFNERMKHIETSCHFVRDMIARGSIMLLHVHYFSLFVGIFIKVLSSSVLQSFMFIMRILNLTNRE